MIASDILVLGVGDQLLNGAVDAAAPPHQLGQAPLVDLECRSHRFISCADHGALHQPTAIIADGDVA
jgi:hypothetical protein